MRIELHRGFRGRDASLPVAGQREQQAHERGAGAVHRVEGEGPLGHRMERLQFPPEKQALRQCLTRQRARGRQFRGSSRGELRASQGVGPRVVTEHVLVAVERRQHGPTVAVVRRLFHGAL
jgi:hypothetical protein